MEEIAESEKLYTAFNISKMDMWQNNPAKQNRIKRALFDVLGTKSETERIFNIFLAHQPKSAGELQQYLSLNYQVGTHISVSFDEQAKNEIIITDVTVDTVNYQFIDMEQAPVSIYRDTFEKYLVQGQFKIVNSESMEQDVSFPYRLLGRLQSDCDYFLGAGQRNEKHLWAGSIKAQIAKMRELYHSVSEKPEWLTEQDIERYEQQMTELQPETTNIDQSIPLAPLEQETAGVSLADRLSEEEISDLVDVVLCADDVTEFTLEWVSEIYDFWNGGHKLSSKANVLKAFYGKLDDDYTTNTGEYLHITGTDEGLDFQVEGQSYSLTYKELAQKIDNLIRVSGLLESTDIHVTWEQVATNIATLIAINQFVNPNTTAPPTKEEVIENFLRDGSGIQGGKGRIYKAMLSMPGKKDRVAFLRHEYGYYSSSGNLENGGHSSLSADGKGLRLEYRLDGVEFDELFSWSAVESRISERLFSKQNRPWSSSTCFKYSPPPPTPMRKQAARTATAL